MMEEFFERQVHISTLEFKVHVVEELLEPLAFEVAFLVDLVVPLAQLALGVTMAFPYLADEQVAFVIILPSGLSSSRVANSSFGYLDHHKNFSFLLSDIYSVLGYILVFSFHYE